MSVPAGSSRSPVEEALDRLDLFFARTPHAGPQEWLATVRGTLERLTEERAQEIQAIVSVLPGHPQGMTPFEYARATAERVDALEAQVERLTEDLSGAYSLIEELEQRVAERTRERDNVNDMADDAESEVARLTEELDGERLLHDQKTRHCDLWMGRAESAESEVTRLTGMLESKDGQPIQNAARALLRATDDAERNAALGDLYNLLAATPPSVARTEGEQT